LAGNGNADHAWCRILPQGYPGRASAEVFSSQGTMGIEDAVV